MLDKPGRRYRILTWHIHGSYLYYLVQSPHEFYLPVKPGRPEAYGGRNGSFPWPDNVHDVPAEEVKNLDIDCVVYQSDRNYLEDQFEILSEDQRRLPRLFLEHDPPRQHPTDTPHPVDDPEILLVHVTHFNQLMWDNRRTPARVIDHGVTLPEGLEYTGDIERGLVIINSAPIRGRIVGLDIFERVRKAVPLDIVGMQSEELGGLGALSHHELLELESHYRFIFNPIRYTSLGLSIIEAMMLGMPVIGLATTEMVTAVKNGVSGYVETDVSRLVEHMQRLLSDRDEARRLGEGARRQALERFNIFRFISDWNDAFASVIENSSPVSEPVIEGDTVS